MSGISARASPASGGPLGLFRSWLPARSAEIGHSSQIPARESEAPRQFCGGAVRVLVADDDPVNLMVISALLQSRGLEPVLAADGAQAVALGCGLVFDLILMDLQMPILDGLAATSAIRRFETVMSRPAVPVVAYSSLSPDADVLAMHGLNGRLNKPCMAQQLEDCLLRWCPTYRSATALQGAAHDLSGRQADSCEPAIAAPARGVGASGTGASHAGAGHAGAGGAGSGR